MYLLFFLFQFPPFLFIWMPHFLPSLAASLLLLTNTMDFYYKHHKNNGNNTTTYTYINATFSFSCMCQCSAAKTMRIQVKDICNELEVRTLCHKILQNVSILLNADRGSLFLVQGRCNTGNDGPKKWVNWKIEIYSLFYSWK